MIQRLLVILLLFFFASGCSKKEELLWTWNLESRSYANPIIDEDNVYIASQAGEVISGKFETGKKNWSIKVDGPILADPDYSDQLLFTATQNGFVYGLDKKTGQTVWKRNLDPEHFTAPLTYTNDLLIVPSRDGTLFALSSNDGSEKWKIPGNVKYNTKAIVAGRYIFLGGWANDFLCLNMDGTVNWRYKASHVIVEPALIEKNVVYFTAHDHYVYALDVPSGRLLWRFKATYPTEMLLIQNQLVFGSKSDLLVLNPQDGKLIRTIKTDRTIDRIFNWNGQCIVVSGKIYQIDTKTGDRKQLIPGKRTLFKIAFPPGIFVVSDDFNRIFAFRQQEHSSTN